MTLSLIFLGIVLLIVLIVSLGFMPDTITDKATGEVRASPKSQLRLLYAIPAFVIGLGVFNGAFFWAEPGYKYHVRTITGVEKMEYGSGFKVKNFGRVNEWKNSISVQAKLDAVERLSAEDESSTLSATIPAKRVVFLDQVDARVSATARWDLPDDEDAFLRLVRDFRTPENLLRTELIPAFSETIEATATLMGAEEYFSGGRSAFVSEFEDQMRNGLYRVRRTETKIAPTSAQRASANAALGEDQEEFGENEQVVYQVEKLTDSSGIPLRKAQSYSQFGISITTARIVEMDPNAEFDLRMKRKQTAAADRSIAREERIQEEEQRLLEVAKGERRVAERQAEAKVTQIEQTTNAETDKQLAITQAEKQLESERILKQQAEVALERARLEAAAVKVRADAAAYEKAELLKADNALQAKLDAEVAIQSAYADALAKRQVPSVYIAGGEGSGPGGENSETQAFMAMMTAFVAERMDYEREVKN